ncbi:hypothetical protein L0152_05620 [bacterium]|nr:hypothetical protein [bacterium]
MKNKMIFVLVLMSSAFLFAMESDLPNLYQPRYLILTSGQPTNLGYQILQQMGVQTVINVLPEAECDPGERSMVIANDMVYFSQPFDPININRDIVVRFGKLIKHVEKPVLVHCSTGNHVGGMWFAFRVLIEKAPIGTAIAEARQIGMKPEMENAVLQWLANGAI